MTNLDIFLIDYEIYKANPNWWMEIIEIFLKAGLRFRASFNKEDRNILEKLSTYESELKISVEKHLILVERIINKEIIRDFMENYKVISKDDIDYYGPFYSMEIGDNYTSAHHGSELYLTNLSDYDLKKVLEIVNPLKNHLKIDFI